MRRRSFLFGSLAVGVRAVAATPPQRVVSVAPTVTEMLYGIGAFDRVVAVTEYCTYPPEAKALPKVGGWATPSIERIAGFQPGLVAFTEIQAPFLDSPLKKLGIRTLIARSTTIQDAFNSMEALGSATGTERGAANLVAQVKASLDAVRRRAAGLPHPSVLCIIDRTPGTLRDLYAAIEGSFLAELIVIAGGSVVGGVARGGYGRISKEAVLTANPEIVLDLMPIQQPGASPELAWRDLPELKAVRRGGVHIVREEYAAHDSQLIAKTAVVFAQLLHPEVPKRKWEPR
jgi:iron complex transport system substrate-binding protein